MLRFWLARPRWIAGCALLLVAIAYGAHLGTPALYDKPNDGQYAEVAREMVVSGNWASPQLDFVLFLNKPPLLYWLIASSFTAFGINEGAARLPGLLAMLVTLGLLFRLGEELFDSFTGLSAAAVLASTPAMLWEARSVRPDLLITATTTGAILAGIVALRAEGPRRTRALYGLQLALALGLLAKGMIALILPALPIAVAIVWQRRIDLARTLLSPRSWWLFLVLIVPWHAWAVWRHPGFFWDYVVNQHLLFFLDRKEPRDSIPISLPLFWIAVMLRMMPWTLTVPLATVFALRQCARHVAAMLVPVVWAAGTLGFFSVTFSRLEHYALPALPALALLLAVALRQAPSVSTRWRMLVSAHYVATALLLGLGMRLLPPFLADDPWLKDAPGIVSLAGPFLGVFAVAMLIAAAGTVVKPSASVLAVFVIAATALATTPMIRRGFSLFAPINSSAPVADAIKGVATDETRVVFEAPIEYQTVAGLNFYLRRPVTLLRPAGFVEPTYLRPYRDVLFIDRDRLRELWQREDVILVSDPLADPDRPLAGVIPAPFSIVTRIGNQWVVRNRK